MGDIPYKLQVKLGTAEFTAEGPEGTVKADYTRFLEAIATKVNTSNGATKAANADERKAPDTSSLERIYIRDGDIISLRHLPDTPNRAADAAILLLYGYRQLAAIEDVPVTKLNEGLRKSGLNFERVDRFLPTHAALYRKGGQRSGSRYSLNNQGVLQAEQWLRDWN